MDGRKRTWLAMDVQYYDAPLAVGIRDRFGIVGVVVFDAFLRACKRSSIEGQISYSSVPDFLNVVGLPALELVDEQGTAWELDALWTYLGRMKNTSKTRSGRITYVKSTRWGRWQNARSRPGNTSTVSTGNEHNADHYRTGQGQDISISSPSNEEGERRPVESKSAMKAKPHGSLERFQSAQRLRAESA